MNVGSGGTTGSTVGAYVASFVDDLPWEQLVRWPADVFAVTNLMLDRTEAYRFAASPWPGGRWPPDDDWMQRVTAAAAAWREIAAAASDADPPAPPAVCAGWQLLLEHRDMPLEELRRGEARQLVETLLTLHAVADEAHRDLAVVSGNPGPFEQRVRGLLDETGSIARIEPRRARVTPKTQKSSRGLTIRSFSRYLALNYEAIDIRWQRVAVGAGNWVEGRRFHQVLLPWPLTLDSRAFAPVDGPIGMDEDAFGFFAFRPSIPLDLGLVETLLDAANQRVERIDSLMLPEGALSPEEIAPIESLLARAGVGALVAGVRCPPIQGRMARNYVHMGFRTPDGWIHLEQDKHHRWCLDESQIRQYHLTRSLSPRKRWWEAIEIPPRGVVVIDVGGGATMVPLVCEDLARLDQVADVLRRIGPSFVVALLLDGPQLAQRWACRYASVLSEDPGSSVLTLTSLGMAGRSRPPGLPVSRTIATWSDPWTGTSEITLARGASAVLITSTVDARRTWTADGRRHEVGMPASILTGVEQLRVPMAGRRPQRARQAVAAGRPSLQDR